MSDGPPIHPTVDRLAAYSWRLIVIGIALVPVAWVVVHLGFVAFAIVAATLLTVALAPVARMLRRRGLKSGFAAWLTLVGFLALLSLAAFLIVPAVVDEFADLGPTVSEGIDDLEDWLVEDSPFDLTRERVEELREDAGDALSSWFEGSSGTIIEGAVLALETVAGALLALVLTFFLLKDGERFQAWMTSLLPEDRRDLVRRVAARGWWTLGGYLRGAAMLGVVEGIIISVVITIVGASLAIPLGVLTFFAAFIPFVGAIAAGFTAVLVTFVSAGVEQAVIVAAVALVVQQVDNEVLAPVIYGRALQLHPAVVLLAVASGGALAGAPGAVLAVPMTGVVLNVIGEARNALNGDTPSATDDPTDVPATP